MNPIVEQAAEVLNMHLKTLENNAPINRADGKIEQAELEEKGAESIRAALVKLSE